MSHDTIILQTQRLLPWSEAEKLLLEAPHWEERYRRLLNLNKIDLSLNQNLPDGVPIKGCQSKAWLWATTAEQKVFFWGQSESKLVQALFALILARWNGLNAQELKDLDPLPWLESLKLQRHLNTSRMGGLRGLVDAMQEQGAHLLDQ